ncbi:Fatty acid desaturase [Planctomycetes bacterium CA13]|uniref:Fatty acid desaturase n=1 Tax=Novipirellula herctigrandis TaxID=2527986 RepID=A0A5C5YZS6_9BACT|nr:Fatty acid desaturase [Planctomycetes bacterium CA13]
MLVHNPSDYRSVLWLLLAITLVIAQYCNPALVVFLSPISCYLAISLGTVSHNHNHRATFKSTRLNNLFGHLLTIFYGYPTLMWVPTHNLNHHKFVNRPGDATATWRYTNKHNLWVALTYPFVSGYFQSIPIRQYIDRIKTRKPNLYSRVRFQYALWIGTYVGLGVLAATLYHHQQTGLGLYLWFFSVILPAILSSTVIMFFNFIQHVHTDAWSDHDHSRNFTGPWFNFLFFNNGYHTVHHDHPAMHWSELPDAHARIAETIDPKLNETNLVWFLLRQYFLSALFPQLGTKQIGNIPGQSEIQTQNAFQTQSAIQTQNAFQTQSAIQGQSVETH